MVPKQEAGLAPPMFELEVFSEANAVYWRKYLWHCWDFSTHSTVTQHPPQWFCAPPSDL